MEILNNHLFIETEKTIVTKKKMTGHDFVTLAGYDPYSKRGDKILQMLNIYKPPFDEKYVYRGNIAEEIIKLYYTRKANRPFVYYDEKTKKENHYDFFPTYKQCGGIPDFEMQDESEIVEGKSKSMKDYDKIVIKGEIPIYELYQCLYYCYLRKVEKGTMFYIFFDEQTEKEIFEGKKPTTFKNIKLYTKTYNVADYEQEIKEKINEALYYYNYCVRFKQIPLEDISQQILEKLDIIRGYNINEL